MASHVDLRIPQGKTVARVLRVAASPYIYKAITAITQAAPARLTVTGHGLPDGWPVAVVSVKGMRQINALCSPPGEEEYRRATVVDVNTIELNDVNSSDFTAYSGGGYVQTYTPVDLAGGIARLTVRDRVGGTALVSMDSATLGGIVLDNTAKTVTYTFAATATAAYTWTTGVFELEFEDANGVVITLERGTVAVDPKEIAT
jgi:hypothetical protein